MKSGVVQWLRNKWAGWMAISLLGLTACQTTPKVDWDARVGTWTYDDMVKEMGPSDRMETLSDGTKVAEWRIQRGTTIPRYEVVGYYDDFAYPYHPYARWGMGRARVFQGYRSDVRFPDRSVRMIFNPEGVLESVKPFHDE